MIELYRYGRQVSYVFRHNIRSRADAEERRAYLQESMRRLKKEKKKLRSELGSGSNYQRIGRLLSIQEEIKKFPEGSRPDLMEEAVGLVREITRGETLDESLARFHSVNKVLDDLTIAAKQVRKELQTVDSILGMEDADPGYMKTRGSGQAERRRITVNGKAIRMSGRYAVLDEAGAQIRTDSGRELMKRSDDRTQRRIMNITKNSDSL